MAFINESGKFVFIDDFSGWGEEAQLKNFRFGPAMEGNKLIANTGEEFGFQYVSMRRGNHLTVQLRDHREKAVSSSNWPTCRFSESSTSLSGPAESRFRVLLPSAETNSNWPFFCKIWKTTTLRMITAGQEQKPKWLLSPSSCTRTTPTKPNPFWTIWIKKIINRFSTRPHRRVFYFRIHLNWLSLLPRRLYRLTALFCLSASS